MRAADLFRKYRRSINPPYSRKDLFTVGSTLFILVAIPLTVLLALQAREWGSRAAGSNAIEAESASLSGPVTVGDDANASGGKYIQFGTASSFQPTAPYYATFYYPWFQNYNTDKTYGIWSSNSHSAPTNWFSNYLPDVDTTKFDQATELYSSNDDTTIYWQLRKLAEAKQEVAISSWWGRGDLKDLAFKHIVTDVMNRTDNPYPNLRWTIYYEPEGQGNPTVSTLVSDLNYIKTNYTSQPSYLKIGGKPVIFVYSDATDGADMASRWAQAKAQVDFYVVLKVYSGYKTDPNQPDSWHQYAPAVRSDSQTTYSYAVSPGFWRAAPGDVVRLPRNLTEFKSAVSSMVASSATWKLTETWNEWGEGTAVEPGDQVIQKFTTDNPSDAKLDPNGVPFKNQYVDALNQALPALEKGTGALASKAQPKVAGAATDPILVGAGDISWAPPTSPQKDMDTAALIKTLINAGGDVHVFTAGDNVNEASAPYNFYVGTPGNFDKSWGQFKSFIRPAAGNHDFAPLTVNGASSYGTGYFSYYNGYSGLDSNGNPIPNTSGPAGDPKKGWYSYNLGAWHIIVLNSSCEKNDVYCGTLGSSFPNVADRWNSELAWLKADLEANKTTACTAAIWHRPLFTSGQHGDSTATNIKPLWDALYPYGVDVVINGHSHDYERFAPQDPNGVADPKGITEFVAGTGGRANFASSGRKANSVVLTDNPDLNGVLKLTLHPTSYDWQFIPIAGSPSTFVPDSGSANCVSAATPGSDTEKPSVPTKLTATVSQTEVNLSWAPSTDNVGVTGYNVYRGGTKINTALVTATSYNDTGLSLSTTYTYQVSAVDAATNESDKSLPYVRLPTDKGFATTTISITDAGNYKIWSRVMAPDTTTNNSYWFQVDSDSGTVVGGAAITANNWTWVDYKDGNSASKITMSLSAGSHNVNMIGRETGVKLDRLIFTTDQNCVPTGTGDNCLGTQPPPTVDLKANSLDGPVTIDNNTAANLSWTSANATSCTASGAWSGSKATSGSQSTGSLSGPNSYTYALTCAGPGGSASDSVTVNVTPPTTKTGDLNSDNKVDIYDLSILLTNWGATSGVADINKDGIVNIIDLSTLISNWGS